MNRALSFGVLLFSFALAMLGFEPKGGSVIITIPKEAYWVIGAIAIILALLLVIIAIRVKWFKWIDKKLESPRVYAVWLVIFEGLYILSYLKGFSAIMEVSPPSWVMYPAIIVGYGLALYIPVIAIKYWPSKESEN